MLTTENTPVNSNRCIVAPPRGATAQQHTSSDATGSATETQQRSLKALAFKHLKRNGPRNDGATQGEKTVQQTGEKPGHFVARVADEIDGFDGPVFTRLATAASRVCREIHGDNDHLVNDMIEDLKHYPPSSWDWLADHFEGQLHTQPEPQQPATAVRCCDCQRATITSGIAACGAGVDSGLPIAGYWHDDRHLCSAYWGVAL